MPFSYYCSYCDKKFQSNHANIKKHNRSKHHLKLKNDYYKQFNEIEEGRF